MPIKSSEEQVFLFQQSLLLLSRLQGSDSISELAMKLRENLFQFLEEPSFPIRDIIPSVNINWVSNTVDINRVSTALIQMRAHQEGDFSKAYNDFYRFQIKMTLCYPSALNKMEESNEYKKFKYLLRALGKNDKHPKTIASQLDALMTYQKSLFLCDECSENFDSHNLEINVLSQLQNDHVLLMRSWSGKMLLVMKRMNNFICYDPLSSYAEQMFSSASLLADHISTLYQGALQKEKGGLLLAMRLYHPHPLADRRFNKKKIIRFAYDNHMHKIDTTNGTRLHMAVINNDLTTAEILVTADGKEANICLNSHSDDDSFLPLYTAAKYGLLEMVRILLPHTDVNLGPSPFVKAASHNYIEIVKYFLATRPAEFLTLQHFMHAFANANADVPRLEGIWRYLLQYATETNCLIDGKRTFLHHMVINGDFKITKLLLEAGADPNIADSDSHITPLMSAAQLPGSLRIIMLLIAYGADIHAKDNKLRQTAEDYAKKGGDSGIQDFLKSNPSPLIAAVQLEDLQVLKSCIEKGYPLEAQDESLNTALMHAVRLERVDMVECLLSYSVDRAPYLVNIPNKEWRTPLMEAAMRGQVSILKLLVLHGGKVEDYDSYEKTAFSYAIENHQYAAWEFLNNYQSPGMIAAELGKIDLLTLLIHSGNFAINAKDNSQRTAFMYAVLANQGEAMRLLLLNNAEPIHPEDPSQPVIFYFIQKSKYDLLKILLSSHINPNEENKDGCTPLMLAAVLKDKQAVRLLLENERVREAIDRQGLRKQTALMCAAKKDAAESVELLLKSGANPFIKDEDGAIARDYVHPATKSYALLSTAMKEWKYYQVLGKRIWEISTFSLLFSSHNKKQALPPSSPDCSSTPKELVSPFNSN